ncbi:MAG TPA: sensor histidine kinase, partial [Acidobacteriota bacterium]|nr:sensor histidine kinase [Acidobacteriota bacterium]
RLEMERAEVFFSESLSPYEMAHRGFRDGIAALRQINETLEREIQRIAHAVHDEAGQLLVGARLAMAELAADLGPNGRKGLESVGTILGQAEEHLRRFSHELRPTVLDDLGLVPALEFLAGGFSHRSGISVQVKSSLSGRCAPNVEVALYRVVQEALNNVARHAKAKNAGIELKRSGNQLECRVQDDGIGFDTQAPYAPGKVRGLGLVGIRERLTAIGGSLTVDSVRGKGTSLLFRVPVEA